MDKEFLVGLIGIINKNVIDHSKVSRWYRRSRTGDTSFED